MIIFLCITGIRNKKKILHMTYILKHVRLFLVIYVKMVLINNYKFSMINKIIIIINVVYFYNLQRFFFKDDRAGMSY